MKISRIGRIPNLNINLPPLKTVIVIAPSLLGINVITQLSQAASRPLGEVTLKKKYTRVTYILKRKFKQLPKSWVNGSEIS